MLSGSDRGRRSGYTPVVHCGSVRQAARVVAMAEVPLAEDWRIEDACRATNCNLAPAIAAAASLLAQPIPTLEVAHSPQWLSWSRSHARLGCSSQAFSSAGLLPCNSLIQSSSHRGLHLLLCLSRSVGVSSRNCNCRCKVRQMRRAA